MNRMSSSARKMQNRLAQREFRQRKLAYVKELEAKVEFFSTSSDEQLETMRYILKGERFRQECLLTEEGIATDERPLTGSSIGLIDENQHLRNVLQSIAGFIGSGAGGKYGNLGFAKAEDLDAWINAPQSDTLERLYQEHKKDNPNYGNGSGEKSSQSRAASPALSPQTATSSRTPAPPAPVGTEPNARKRSRDSLAAQQAPSNPTSLGPHLSMSTPASSLPAGSNNYLLSNYAQPLPPAVSGPSNPVRDVAGTISMNSSANIPYQIPFFSQHSTSAPPPPASVHGQQMPASFFFDVQDPVAAFNNSFTDDFISQFVNTGFTPSLDVGSPSNTAQFNWNTPNNVTGPNSQVGASPSSSVAPSPSSNSCPPPPLSTGLGSQPLLHNQGSQGDAKRYPPGKLNVDFLVQSTPLLQAVHLIS